VVRIVQADIIEIRLFDPDFNKFYQAKANVKNKRQMINLFNELREKGVSFNRGWFD